MAKKKLTSLQIKSPIICSISFRNDNCTTPLKNRPTSEKIRSLGKLTVLNIGITTSQEKVDQTIMDSPP